MRTPTALALAMILPLGAQAADIVINEVCWTGSMASAGGADDEWIELHNTTDQSVDLTDWVLDDDNGESVHALSGSIPAGGFYLIEKREEATSVAADLIDATLGLDDAGDTLELLDDQGTRVDFVDTGAGWYAGVDSGAGVQDISMERIDPDAAGDEAANWADNDGVTVNGTDSEGNPLSATPGAHNAVWIGFCSPDGSQEPCYTGPPGTSGEGECQDGTRTCESGVWGDCLGEVTPVVEACNLLDDDCDAETDEDFDLQTDPEHCGNCTTACGQDQACVGGVCTAVCVDADGDGFGDGCAAGPDCDDLDDQVYPGADELCDQVDNDCDDETDETWPELGDACDGVDADACENGLVVCNDSQDATECAEVVSVTETCNGVDDTCEGEVDEAWPLLGEPCDGPDSDACEEGVFVCNNTGTGVTCDEPEVDSTEDCNGRDDDCDGVTDNVERPTDTCGSGVCEVTYDRCEDGQWQACVPDVTSPSYQVKEASCEDGLDNDCDGFTDLGDADCRGGGGGGSGCGCGGVPGSSPSAVAAGMMFFAWLIARRRRR